MRNILNSDIQAAVRGLDMESLNLSNQELHSLIELHSHIEVFASQVIAEAARQILRKRTQELE